MGSNSALLSQCTRHSSVLPAICIICRKDKYVKDQFTVLDADAKPPSSILDGNVFWTGDYYECGNVNVPSTNHSNQFTGQYCTFSWLIQKNNESSLPLTTGLCVPSTCSENDFSLFNESFPFKDNATLNLNLSAVSCKTKTTKFDASAIVTLFFLIVFILLLLVGTSVTVYSKMQTNKCDADKGSVNDMQINDSEEDVKKLLAVESPKDSFLKNFLKCFCILMSGTKLLGMSGKDLRCIHGIRFLSMSWVILGHTYAFAVLNGLTGNPRKLMHDVDNLPFQVIVQGTFSVDSFFLLSGFLLSYLFLREAEARQGKISWIFFYCHRYWRLTPVYAIVLAFNTALAVYVAEGPFWPNNSLDSNCRETWWWNLLYINNFVDQTKACMNWGWYLANDMQFYVISPLFLYPLWRWPKAGLSLICTLLILSWIATGIISYHYNLLPGYTSITQNVDLQKFEANMAEYFKQLYIKPYTRIGPYLIGIILGYLVSHEMEQKKPMTKVIQSVGWLVAAFASLSVIYGFYHSNPSPTVSMLYNTFSRTIFAASLAWVIYVCLTGHGGIVNNILSCSILVPLSRLTYCAYLVHPIILIGFYQSLQFPIQITHSVMVTLFLGFLLMSYFVALVCSITFEFPLMAVEKLVLLKFRKDSSK